jgi:hypothetical protein
MRMSVVLPPILERMEQRMPNYNAYLIDDDGHVTQRIDLVCADEDTAKEQAKSLADGQPIELWEAARKIAKFDPSQ